MLIPTHQYIRQGALDKVRGVLESGADVNELENGTTPLEMACSYGYLEIAKLLIDHGAKIYLEARTNDTIGLINNSECLFKVIFAAKSFNEKINATSDVESKQNFTERYEDCFKIFELILRHEQKLRQQDPESYKNVELLMRTLNGESLTPLRTLKILKSEVTKRFLKIYDDIKKEKKLLAEVPKPSVHSVTSLKQQDDTSSLQIVNPTTNSGLHHRRKESVAQQHQGSRKEISLEQQYQIDADDKYTKSKKNPSSFWEYAKSFLMPESHQNQPEESKPLLEKLVK